MAKHSRFLIVGGGTGGIMAAARLKRLFSPNSITIIEPSDTHYYQPLWTLVGGGVTNKESSRKPMSDVIPSGVEWIKNHVTELNPENNSIKLSNDQVYTYDYLILCPGLIVDFKKIKGLEGNLGKNGLCSIYDYHQAEITFNFINNFKGGTALFTMPPVPIKCAGAPQKIMYLAEETFRKNGIRNKCQIHYYSNGPAIFGVPVYASALEQVAKSRQIQTHFLMKLIEVKADQKMAIFEKVAPPVPATPSENPQVGTKIEVSYDLLHVAPPNSPPEFISQSKLAWNEGPQKGWLNVDPHTLQNPHYANVFGLGDVTGIPNAKTGAAIRKQFPIMIKNLLQVLNQSKPSHHYDGYSSCPLVTSRSSVILAEFGYDGKLLPSFPIDQTKERYSFWILKRHLLPKMYWWGMLKGRM